MSRVAHDRYAFGARGSGILVVQRNLRLYLLEANGDLDRADDVDGTDAGEVAAFLAGETLADGWTEDVGGSAITWPVVSDARGQWPITWHEAGTYDEYCPDDPVRPLRRWEGFSAGLSPVAHETLAGVLDGDGNPVSGIVVDALSDTDNGVIFRRNSEDAGQTGPGGSEIYGTGQFWMALKEGTGDVLNDRMLARLSYDGSLGLAGNIHVLQGIWIDRDEDGIGLLIDAANLDPTGAYWQARLSDGTVVAQVAGDGRLWARALHAFGKDAATNAKLIIGRLGGGDPGGIANEAEFGVYGSSPAPGTEEGDAFFHMFDADRDFFIHGCLQLQGGVGTKLLRDLDADGKKVEGLPTPVADDEAAPKGYVDDNVPTSGTRFSPQFIGAITANALGQNTLRYSEVFIPYEATITGIQYLVGGVSNGNVKVALYNAAGTKVAESNSTAQGGTNNWQKVPFTAPVDLPPGQYFVAIMSDSATGTGWSCVGFGPAGAAVQGGFTIPASITAPTVSTLSTYVAGTY